MITEPSLYNLTSLRSLTPHHIMAVLIKRGMLARKQSLDLLDGLDMDFLTVGYDGTGKGAQGSFPYQDDFFLDHSFDDRSGSMGMGIMGQDSGSSCDQEVDLDLFRHRRSSSISNSLMGDGSFDLVGGSFFDGLGSYILPPPSSSRKHSLSLPPALTAPRSGFAVGMGTGGEVDMSAYQSMAASLQAQSKANGQVLRREERRENNLLCDQLHSNKVDNIQFYLKCSKT